MFKELFEKTKDKVLYNTDSKELWVTYGQGSGMTSYLPDLTKFITDGDTNYDSIVHKLKKWAKETKPLKTKGNSKLFKIPTYPSTRYGRYDIWGGDIKSNGEIYMVITEEKNTIVNFFDNKNEANAWIKSIN